MREQGTSWCGMMAHLEVLIATFWWWFYVYDPACHLTDSEFKGLHEVDVNVQSMVEKPEIYILACCPSNNHQILYSEEK